MPSTPHPLQGVLRQIQAGLGDSQNHYLVCTNYFETENGPVLLGTLHLQQDTVWNLVIDADSFRCEVLLHPDDPQYRSLVTVNYDQVWQVLHGDGPNFSGERAENILYENTEGLSTFARQGIAE
ncbi:hypothetical protein [Hymenobacter weizhouensis]|uniref:hypothetical protein n=1 Tax=Hymenobacter sp. YIM 151500-1 TaxID=2987689 RepID=UPI0022272437|nr:hypothetical protein [Hymenobacter sp. YIM 151500-1]UYZ65281.1 hypothetical protein OIS53_20035 [Hymenobacter sp. YIM 151500-1]